MGRNVRRVLLGLVTAAVPFVIAACYGVAQRFRYGGRVVDEATRQPVKGLRVYCADEASDGYVLTAEDGTFDYGRPRRACRALRVEDADGAENGVYAAKDVVLDPSDAGELVIGVTPAEPR